MAIIAFVLLLMAQYFQGRVILPFPRIRRLGMQLKSLQLKTIILGEIPVFNLLLFSDLDAVDSISIFIHNV